jgi:UPF0271 protein
VLRPQEVDVTRSAVLGPRLNMDLGELPDEPEALYALAHIANVACGGHAGDDDSMARAVTLCAAGGTALGMHPSYPDREGFGRRERAMSPAELEATVAEQCGRLVAIAGRAGVSVAYAKAHGALYHAATRDLAVARALVAGAGRAADRLVGRRSAADGVTWIGAAGGALERVAADAGVAFAREAFADRATRPDGSLVPRGEPGAVIADEDAVVAQALALARRGDVDTLCLHGDTPGAVALARAVRAALDRGRD